MRSKTHERDSFYKYTSAETAHIILSTLKIRYSSPLGFNDPFDCAHRFDYGFDLAEAEQPYIEACTQIVYAATPPPGDTGVKAYKELLELRARKDCFPKQKLVELLKSHFDTSASRNAEIIDSVNQAWSRFAPSRKMLCVSEIHDNILMWSHYAANHTGAAIEFKCLEDENTALCAAERVNYSDTIPSIFPTITDFILEATGQQKFNTDNFYKRFVLSKSTQWAYEREWRAITYRDNDSLHFDSNVLPQEISAIYLGCKITDDDKSRLLEQLKGELDHVAVYQATKAKYQYKLEFAQIK